MRLLPPRRQRLHRRRLQPLPPQLLRLCALRLSQLHRKRVLHLQRHVRQRPLQLRSQAYVQRHRRSSSVRADSNRIVQLASVRMIVPAWC